MKTLAAILVLLACAGCSTHSQPQAFIAGLVRDSSRFPEFSIAKSESSGLRPAKAIVRSVLGDVQYGNGGVWNPIHLNMELTNGTLIRTGHGASTYLQVNGFTSTIKVNEDSELDLTEMMSRDTNATRTALDVRKGMILGSVKKLSPESSFQVRGGRVTLKVHGTDFQVSAEGWVTIVTGAAVVTSDGKSYHLTTGQSFYRKGNEVEQWPGAEPLSPFERGLMNARLRFLGQ